ncbi:hypothetical protein ACOSP7_018721 [Xanthoceras sorbifolium]
MATPPFLRFHIVQQRVGREPPRLYQSLSSHLVTYGSHSKYSNLLSYARLLQIAQRQFVYPIHCQDAQHASLLELYFVFTGNLKGQTLS